jgi:hypothetical protein
MVFSKLNNTSGKVVILTIVAILIASPLIVAPTGAAAASCSVIILHENGTNTAIQDAINNAELGVTGPIVCVSSSGNPYPEQVVISSSNIQLVGVSKTAPLIQPTSVTSNSADPDSSTSVAAIVLVEGTATSAISGVVIRGINVDGTQATSSFTGCSTNYIGIYFQDASGTVNDNTVNGLYLPPTLAGCQDGLGVFVRTDSGASSNVLISRNTVTNYQKNGITCNDAGTTCTVTANKVSFYSPYAPNIAPNGIQIGFGALGKVTLNTVSGNVCTLSGACGSNLITQSQGTGILTYESAVGTLVTRNTLSGNDLGVGSYLDAGSLPVRYNTIHGSTFAGIVQYDGTYVAARNTLSGNPLGVAVVSDGSGPNVVSHISRNTISGQTYSVQIQTVSPGTAAVTYNGHTYHVSGDSTVDIL